MKQNQKRQTKLKSFFTPSKSKKYDETLGDTCIINHSHRDPGLLSYLIAKSDINIFLEDFIGSRIGIRA